MIFVPSCQIQVKVPLDTVGQSLSEHPAVILSPFSIGNSSIFPRIHPEDTEKLVEEFHRGEGIFTNLAEGPQCFKVSPRAEAGWPNLWMGLLPQMMTNGEPQALSLYSVLGRPRSKGSIQLNGELYKAGVRDDTQLALIDFGLVTHPDDMEDMVEGMKVYR